MNLNPHQLEAVNTSGKNILVFASAGGGKTTVLVSRLLKRIIEDRLPLESILAMTFTNAAALNMKKRLEKRLKEAYALNPQDHFIFEQITKVENAQIFTIHAFCLNIIKEYYYIIGLPKTMSENILGDGTKAKLFNKSYQDACQEFKDFALINRYLNASLFAIDGLSKAVESLINTAISFHDPLEWLQSIKDEKIKSFNDLKENIKFYYLNDLKEQIHLCLPLLQEMVDLNSDHSASFALQLALAQELLKIDDYSYFLSQTKLLLTSIPNIKDNQTYKGLRSALEKNYKKIADKLYNEAQLVKDHNNSIELENAFIDFTIMVYQNYQNAKKEAQVMDFNDFEIYANAILHADNGAIASKLKKRYQEIMIDEFQDTNDSQFSIVKLFANNNLFLVGDIKQSIYRFRFAKPEIMESLKNDPSYHKIHIQNNYRSASNIVDFNNRLFGQIMNIYRPTVDHLDEQITLPIQAENNVPIRFKIALGKDEKANKAKLLANIVYKLHQDGKKFKDIAVLVKTHSEKKAIKYALSSLNIPYFINDNEGYFTSFVIDIIYAYFKLLADNSDRQAMVTILSSPLYNLSDDDLFLFKDNLLSHPALTNDLIILKELAKHNRLSEIIYYILNINNFYLEKLDEQEKANVALLLENIDNYQIDNIADFISFIDDVKDVQAENASTISEEDDVVKVMTIHTSKGLEFDTVILYSTHLQRLIDASDTINIDNDLGVCLSYLADDNGLSVNTIKRRAYLAKENIADILEYQRLLYVALTRPKKELIIIDAIKNEEDITKYDLPLDLSLFYSRLGFTSLIYSAMKDDSLLNVEFQSVLEDFKPLAIKENEQTKIPFKKYDITEYEELSPSSLENIAINLNLDQVEAMNYGTRIHHIMECLNYHQTIDEDAILAIDAKISKKDLGYIISFVNNSMIKNLRAEEIHQELPFYFQDGKQIIHGFMDFVAIKEDKIILIDYKTDACDDPSILIDKYRPQLLKYQEVLSNIYHLPVETYIYAFKHAQFISIM